MNIKIRKFFRATYSATTAVLFLLAGIYIIVLPWSAGSRRLLVGFFNDHPVLASLLGLTFILGGIIKLIYTLHSAKQKQYLIRSEALQTIAVDQNIIQQYVDTYLSELFPQKKFSNEVLLKNNQIHISATLPLLPLPDQREFIKKIEQELRTIFEKTLDYKEEIFMLVNFENQ